MQTPREIMNSHNLHYGKQRVAMRFVLAKIARSLKVPASLAATSTCCCAIGPKSVRSRIAARCGRGAYCSGFWVLQTMISDLDIWRSANELIKQFGDTANIEAAARADELLAKGDIDGQRVWLRIARAVDELQKAPYGKPN
jgi:hypothetical protein